MSARYPICLDLADRTCVVVGGGDVAERKVVSLLAAGARVVVVAPALAPGLWRLRGEGRLEHTSRPYQEGDLADAFLAIAATDDAEANRAVAAEARRRRVLVNVVDDPALCDFTLPAVLRRGDLLVAVSTGGRSPAVARYVREELEDFLTPEHVLLLELAAEVRAELRARGQRASGQAWRKALDGDLLALIREGKLELARARIVARLTGDALDGTTETR